MVDLGLSRSTHHLIGRCLEKAATVLSNVNANTHLFRDIEGSGSMTAKLEVTRLFKIYGPRAEAALTSIRSGVSAANIFASTGQVVAVNDVSFDVPQGEIFTIMGLSGSGKSTLVRCLNRIIEPTSGSIRIDGDDIVAKSRADLRSVRRVKIAMVFQSFALLPHKTVLGNVELGLLIRGEPETVRRAKAQEALERVGLGGWGTRRPDDLSGGMKQRVGLARALASDPDLLLMDEPFSALDPLIRSELQDELLKLQRDIRKTIVFITHDFHEAVRLSDKLAVMREGKFVQVGTPHDIVLRPADGYVGQFSRDLDRTRILCAGDVAQMGVPIIRRDAPASAALAQMQRTGKSHAILVDADGKPAGFVAHIDLNGRADNDRTTAGQYSRGAAPLVPVSTSFHNIYALLDAREPLAVVDGAGAIVGGLDDADIVRQLAAVTREGQTSGQPKASALREGSTAATIAGQA